MTEIELSRRNLIAASGVGLAGTALAGCDSVARLSGARCGNEGFVPLSAEAISDRIRGYVRERGINNWGDDPNKPPPNEFDQVKLPFKPEYMLLIHIASGGAWQISSNHAHFAFADQDPDGRIAHASDIFVNKLRRQHKRFKAEGRGKPYSVHDRAPTMPVADFADEIDFDNLNFRSPHDIYVFYEHKPNEVRLDTISNQLVTFSQFHSSGIEADENRAFFNARLVTDTKLLGGLDGKGSLIRLENHYTVWNGSGYDRLDYNPADPQHYKMNLLYVAATGIVMAIDPDDGNGVGSGP